jgi:hypothetical protein
MNTVEKFKSLAANCATHGLQLEASIYNTISESISKYGIDTCKTGINNAIDLCNNDVDMCLRHTLIECLSIINS